MTDHSLADIRHALTRRQTLQYSGLALAALPLWRLFGMPTTLTVAKSLSAGETRAGEWSVSDTVTAFAADGDYQFAAPYEFAALGAHWAAEGGEEIHLAISSSADGVAWEPWRIVHRDTHRPDPDRGPGRADRHFAELLQLPASRYVRCKVVDHDGRAVSAPPDLRLVYIDAGAGPRLADLPAHECGPRHDDAQSHHAGAVGLQREAALRRGREGDLGARVLRHREGHRPPHRHAE